MCTLSFGHLLDISTGNGPSVFMVGVRVFACHTVSGAAQSGAEGAAVVAVSDLYRGAGRFRCTEKRYSVVPWMIGSRLTEERRFEKRQKTID